MKQGKTIINAAHDYLTDIHYQTIYQLKNGQIIQDQDFKNHYSL